MTLHYDISVLMITFFTILPHCQKITNFELTNSIIDLEEGEGSPTMTGLLGSGLPFI